MPLEEPKTLSEQRRLFRSLFYGDFGQGKTTQSGQIAKVIPGNALYVTTDSNWTVLSNIPELEYKVARLRYQSYGDWRDGQLRLYGMLHDIVDKYKDGKEYSTLVLDTVSFMVDITRIHLTKKKKFKDQRTPDASSWTHYNLIKDQLVELVIDFTNTNLNIIYIAHEREPTETERESGNFKLRPDLPESTFKTLARECNLIGYCFKDRNGGDYKFQTEGTSRITAKSQIPTVKQTIYKADQIAPLIQEWIN